ncbi:TraI domain-containing protein [Paraburkholderia sp. SARCC-3016]|uniref:TraI domain-containing protein n=1 Tax=Paraburkholderia sp. SARCC-3016 TaxID=3058611 RepID=UPI00280828E2|nr:TraI domain-containing protein [Paraburkholderia sp. SARCC-3016]MDQ7979933.1 TraI domain-containing protein [Paraburkholderia sp. SARCC-3016]
MTIHTSMDAQTLLARYERRIDLISQCANEAGRPDFERKWVSVLRGCAAWFSSLPLSPQLYREPGGAFRCTVETAFYAMRLAGGQKFGTNLPSEKRRRVEPQYNYAVFLAAVCSRLDEPYRHFVIERDGDQQVWNPSVHGAAGAWLAGSEYRVLRREQPLAVERMRTGMLAQILVGSDLLSGLDGEVLSDLFGAINPNMQPLGAESVLHKVVRQGVSTADEFDRKAQRAVFAPVQFDVPSAVHVAAELEPVIAPAPAPQQAAAPSAPSAAAAVTPSTDPDPASESALASQPTTYPVYMPPAARQQPLSQATSVSAGEGNPSPQTLHEALGIPPATQVPAATPQPAAVDPSAMKDPAQSTGTRRDSAPPAAFDEVLKGVPNLVRELFQALREDVAAGKAAAVQWNDRGLVLPKRLVGGYGVSSSTLVEHMRKRSLMVADEATQITLTPRAGQLILDRPA